MDEGKRDGAESGSARRRLRGDREGFCGAPTGGLGACHAARASLPLAEKRRRRRKLSERPARRGHAEHCLHGKDAVIEDILDWRPFDYVTQTALLPIPGAPKFLMTYAFEERDDGGAHFEFRVAKPKPKDLPFYEQVWPTVEKNFNAPLSPA